MDQQIRLGYGALNIAEQESLRAEVVRLTVSRKEMAISALYETVRPTPVYANLRIDRAWLHGQRMIPAPPAAVEGQLVLTLAPGLPSVEVTYNTHGVRMRDIYDYYTHAYLNMGQQLRNVVELKLHSMLVRARPTDYDFVRFTNRLGLLRHGSMSRMVETHGGSLLCNVLKVLIKGQVLKNKIIRQTADSPFGNLPGGMPDGPVIMVHLGGINNDHPHGTSQKLRTVLEAVRAGNSYKERISGGMRKY